MGRIKINRIDLLKFNLLDLFFAKNKIYKLLKSNEIDNDNACENLNYKKFVIFAHQRTGSSYIYSALNKCENIQVFGELFNSVRVGFNEPGFSNLNKTMFLYRNKYPVEFLQNIIFSAKNNKIENVGFKLFYDQIKSKNLLNHINNSKQYKVIHLYRKNYLDVFFSLVKAKQTKIWSSIKATENHNNIKLKLEFEECNNFFKKYKSENLKIKKLAKNKPYYYLTYKDLFDNPSKELNKIFNFLEIENFNVILPKQKKLETMSLKDKIINFDYLKDKFKDSEFIRFFE